MTPTELAIARLRRDLTLTSLVKILLFAAALFSFFIETIFGQHVIAPSLALSAIAIVWILLSYRSMKGTRLAALSPTLIAAGQFEQAEQHIDLALRSFSLFRTVKLRTLHYLALLRHAQRRYAESALLCHTLLSQRLGNISDLTRSTQLILADSLLELGDLPGTYHALSSLYQHHLSLPEALELLAIQTDYLSRIGAWQDILTGLPRKLQLAELMPSQKSARTQALLALAAQKTNRPDWESYLRRRVELLADIPELLASRPLLSDLWPTKPNP